MQANNVAIPIHDACSSTTGSDIDADIMIYLSSHIVAVVYGAATGGHVAGKGRHGKSIVLFEDEGNAIDSTH